MCVCVYLLNACSQLLYTEDDIEDVMRHPSVCNALGDAKAHMTSQELLDAYTAAQEERVDVCRNVLRSLDKRFNALVDTVNGDNDAVAAEEKLQILRLLLDDERKTTAAIKQEQKLEQEKWAMERRKMRDDEIRAAKDRDQPPQSGNVLLRNEPDAHSTGAACARAALVEKEQEEAALKAEAAAAAAAKPAQPL